MASSNNTSSINTFAIGSQMAVSSYGYSFLDFLLFFNVFFHNLLGIRQPCPNEITNYQITSTANTKI